MNGAIRAAAAVSGGRVKSHEFAPSGRSVWTVVGKDGEHWVYPEEKFCSCLAHYFAAHEGRPGCYHLDSVMHAISHGGAVRIAFSDDEYAGFVAGLASGLRG